MCIIPQVSRRKEYIIFGHSILSVITLKPVKPVWTNHEKPVSSDGILQRQPFYVAKNSSVFCTGDDKGFISLTLRIEGRGTETKARIFPLRDVVPSNNILCRVWLESSSHWSLDLNNLSCSMHGKLLQLTDCKRFNLKLCQLTVWNVFRKVLSLKLCQLIVMWVFSIELLQLTIWKVFSLKIFQLRTIKCLTWNWFLYILKLFRL